MTRGQCSFTCRSLQPWANRISFSQWRHAGCVLFLRSLRESSVIYRSTPFPRDGLNLLHSQAIFTLEQQFAIRCSRTRVLIVRL